MALSPIDHLRRAGKRTVLDEEGFDPSGLMLASGEVVSGPNAVSRAQGALMREVDQRRRDARMVDRVGRDPRWDAWFGALQAKGRYAGAHGKRLAVDLMGEGPGTGTGFGRWGARVDGGTTINLDDPGANDMLAAHLAIAEAMRARQQREQQQAVRPYTGMFSRPDPRVAALADAAEVEAAVADASRRRAEPTTPAPAQQPTRMKRPPPVNRIRSGTYRTPR